VLYPFSWYPKSFAQRTLSEEENGEPEHNSPAHNGRERRLEALFAELKNQIALAPPEIEVRAGAVLPGSAGPEHQTPTKTGSHRICPHSEPLLGFKFFATHEAEPGSELIVPRLLLHHEAALRHLTRMQFVRFFI
jgi:hypothetical protein